MVGEEDRNGGGGGGEGDADGDVLGMSATAREMAG